MSIQTDSGYKKEECYGSAAAYTAPAAAHLGVANLLTDPEVTEFKNAIISQIKTSPISLDPMDINKDYLETVVQQLRQKFEGKIFEEGYLIPGSIQLLSVGNGMKTGSHFTGRLVFHVKYSANYYVPIRGIEIICQVLTINKFGVLGRSIIFPAEIVIPRQLQNDVTLTGGKIGVSALSPPNLNRNDLVRVKIIDYAHKSNSLTIVGVVVAKVANLEEHFELQTRMVKLSSSLFQNGYEVVISETRDDNRAENPFRYLNNSLHKFKNHIKNLNEAITLLSRSPKQSGGAYDDDEEENDEDIDEDGADEDDVEGDGADDDEKKAKTNVRLKMEKIVKIIAEINKEMSSFIIKDRHFKEISTHFTTMLSKIEEMIAVALDNLSSQRELQLIDVDFSALEEKISTSGFSFFDNSMKNEIEKLQNQLGTLSSEEKALLKATTNKIWTGFNDGGRRIYGVKQIINPYELVPDRFEQQQQQLAVTEQQRQHRGRLVGSRAFFKFIEIDNCFRLTSRYTDRPMISYHIAEGPGGFVHATAKQRSANAHFQNDRYYGVTRKFQWAIGRLVPNLTADRQNTLWRMIESRQLNVFPNITTDFVRLFKDGKHGFKNYQSTNANAENVKPEDLSAREFNYYISWLNQRGQQLTASFLYDRHQPTSKDYLSIVIDDPDEYAILDWNNYPYSQQIKAQYPDQVQLIYGLDDKLDTGNIMNNGLLFNMARENQHYQKVDLVTADGATEEDSVLKELYQSKLFFHESLWALTLLRDGGDYVLKIFDIHRQITYELIGLLSEYFQETYIYKPKTSRQANTEKYIVCRYFKGIRPEKLAVLRNLSNKWHEQTSEMAKYHFVKNESSDSHKLVLNYGKRRENKLERVLRLYKYLGYLENWQTFNRGEMYELSLTPDFYQKISGEFEYRLEELFLLRKEKNNLISTFLRAGFDITVRDQITSFQNLLYSNEMFTLNLGVNEYYQNIIKCLRRPDLIKETFGIDTALNVSTDKLATVLLKHLNDRNNRETVRRLEENADKWLGGHIQGDTAGGHSLSP